MKTIYLFTFFLFLAVSCDTNTKPNPRSRIPKVEPKSQDSSRTNIEEHQELIGSGTINTVVDGYDVKTVNLWQSAYNKDKIVCSLKNGMKVNIVKEVGEYYLIESVKTGLCKGYCMQEFVKMESK